MCFMNSIFLIEMQMFDFSKHHAIYIQGQKIAISS